MRRKAFTLIELLVVITIIGILAGMMMGALQMARNSAREMATKSTIAKLNTIIMRRYESYMTRRVPLTMPPGTPPATAAGMRLDGIRDIMRMEMPDHYTDITQGPYAFTWGKVPEPALHKLYAAKPATTRTANAEPGKCLYMLVSIGSPETMEQFSQNEIGVDSDGWQYFVDGWGSPILFLRWAPGFSNQYTSPLGFTGPSDIQTGNATTDHDPFDPRNIDNGQGGLPNAFQLFPLIYSSRGFQVANAPILFIGGTSYQYAGNPYQAFPDSVSGKNLLLGTPTGVFANVHNHHIEQR